MAQTGIDILPALAGAAAVVAYGLSRVRVSSKRSGKWEECEAEIEVVNDRRCSCPEPEPEEQEPMLEQPAHLAAPAVMQELRFSAPWRAAGWNSHVGLVIIALVICACVVPCVWLEDSHAKSPVNEVTAPVVSNSEVAVPDMASVLASDAAPDTASLASQESLESDLANDGIATMSESELPVESAPHSASAAADLYRVKLSRQAMPIYAIGEVVYYRSAYYGTLNVGTPGVPFTVVFDTGSGHLILPSTYCHTETCKVHNRYRRSISQSGTDIDYDGTPVAPGSPRDQITVSFGTGEVTGVFVEDLVCMDDGEGAKEDLTAVDITDSEQTQAGCVRMRFIAATDMSEDPFKSFQFDGVLGLGLPGLSQTPDFNLLEVVSGSVHNWGGALNPHTFSVFLAEGSSEESEITFGGWEQERLAEELGWNKVLMPEMGHWLIEIKSMRVGDERVSFCDNGCKAVVDTGTSLFAVPTVAFPELYEMMRHPAPLLGHCRGHGPELHIELEGGTLTLEPRDYARLEKSSSGGAYPQYLPNNQTKQQKDDGPATRSDVFCKPMLMALDLPEPLGPNLFILGEPILRKYYTVYDGKAKSVGIGLAKHRAGARPADFLLAGGDTYVRGSIFKEFRRRKLAASR